MTAGSGTQRPRAAKHPPDRGVPVSERGLSAAWPFLQAGSQTAGLRSFPGPISLSLPPTSLWDKIGFNLGLNNRVVGSTTLPAEHLKGK